MMISEEGDPPPPREQFRTMDPAGLNDMQPSTRGIFGLTARQEPLSSENLKPLANIGVKLIFGALPEESLKPKIPSLWKQTISFLRILSEKGDLLQRWFEANFIVPGKIVVYESQKTSAR